VLPNKKKPKTGFFLIAKNACFLPVVIYTIESADGS